MNVVYCLTWHKPPCSHVDYYVLYVILHASAFLCGFSPMFIRYSIFTPPMTHPTPRHLRPGYGMLSHSSTRFDEAMATEMENLRLKLPSKFLHNILKSCVLCLIRFTLSFWLAYSLILDYFCGYSLSSIGSMYDVQDLLSDMLQAVNPSDHSVENSLFCSWFQNFQKISSHLLLCRL